MPEIEPVMLALMESQQEMEDMANQPEPMMDPAEVGLYQKCADKLSGAHKQGIDALVKTAMNMKGMPCDSWVMKRKMSKVCEYSTLKYQLWLMMIGWDESVLEHFVLGDIPRAYREDPQVSRVLRQQRSSSPDDARPCIYAQYLADRDGNSPKVSHLLKIIEYIELYIRGFGRDDDIESASFSVIIDGAASRTIQINRTTFAEAKNGFRRYIDGPEQLRKC